MNHALKPRRSSPVLERRRRARKAPGFPSRRGQKLVEGLTKPELVRKYEHKVRLEARAMANRWPSITDFDDLVSMGYIGLMDAADKFDGSRGVKFETYAGYRIRGAMLDELRREDWVPRSARARARALERASEAFENERHRPATDKEMSKALGMSVDKYRKVRKEVSQLTLVNYETVANLSEQQEEAANTTLATGSRTPDLIEEVSRKDARALLDRLFEQLGEDERLVLQCYYYRGLTLSEIGAILEVSESRVSQIHSKALLHLKENLATQVDSPQALILMLFDN